MLRDLVRGLGEDLGVGRNDTDGARNADKPSSEFHISHHPASFILRDQPLELCSAAWRESTFASRNIPDIQATKFAIRQGDCVFALWGGIDVPRRVEVLAVDHLDVLDHAFAPRQCAC
jgi:hypothetical protein